MRKMFFNLYFVVIFTSFIALSGSEEVDKDLEQEPVPSEPESCIKNLNQDTLNLYLGEVNCTAVYWYARNCKRSESILKELEKLYGQVLKSGLNIVRINDKRYGKSLGVKKFPSLSILRRNEIVIYEGDMKDKEDLIDFLTDEDNLAIPDKIQEADREEMLEIVEENALVAVFFYDESKVSAKALDSMENIDEETDIFNIRFLRVNDKDLANDYSLPQLPVLVYYRQQIPVVYEGLLSESDEVLEWLIVQKSGADETDTIEFVNGDQLDVMVANVDFLLVLFLDNTRMSTKVLEILENIDDDCDKLEVSFVAIKDKSVAIRYSMDEFPSLLYFEGEIPSIYDGDMEDTKSLLKWVEDLVHGSAIEEVTNEMLDKFITTKNFLAVLFYKKENSKSDDALRVLEEIDDDLDQFGIMFVKIDDEKEADEYGIETLPAIVVFENGIPNVYGGPFDSGESILEWIISESSGDHTIESVTDSMLETLVSTFDHVGVIFYDKDEPSAKEALENLESIDDDAADFQFSIKLVKMDDKEEAEEFGITELPTLLYFDKMIPNMYTGNILDNQEILGWMTDQAAGSHIERISNKILEKLKKKYDDVTVVFYDKADEGSRYLLQDLEEIDNILEQENIPLVTMENKEEGSKWGLKKFPGIVHFQYKEPHLYEVSQPSGMETVNAAIKELMDTVPQSEWKTASVSVAPSTVQISFLDGFDPIDCRVRFLSFLGIGNNVQQAAFIMHTTQDTFVCHVFHCEPTAGPLCKTIEAACKLRYQKCLDARPTQPEQTSSERSSIGATIKNMFGALTAKGRSPDLGVT